MDYFLAHPLSVVNSVICLALFYHCICRLNSRKFPIVNAYAWGYKFLALWSFASAIGPVYGYTEPQLSEVLMNFGILVIVGAVVYRQLYRKPKDETST